MLWRDSARAVLLVGRNDPGFAYNGPLAGLVAICAGSEVMHPIGALVTGLIAGALFVVLFTRTQNRWKIETCWASGRCTVCAARGAGSLRGFSAHHGPGAWAVWRSRRSCSARCSASGSTPRMSSMAQT